MRRRRRLACRLTHRLNFGWLPRLSPESARRLEARTKLHEERPPLARYRRIHLEQRPNTVAASVIGPVEGVLYGSGNRPAGALILDAGTKIDDPVARQSRAKIQISGRTEVGMGLRVHVSTKRCCQSRTDWHDDFGERRAQLGRAHV